MQNKGPYYITTAIAYTSGKPHIGNCYEIILADAIARYKKADGFDVHFQTGSDEHGQKIETRAIEEGVSPKEFVDRTAGEIKRLWDLMGTDYDRFIRTTDADHEEQIRKIFKKMYEKGDIYKGAYEGKYCTECEAFYTESQLEDGKCPVCGGAVHEEKEEAYFFKMSKYADRLIEHINSHPEFIQPVSRKNEMMNNFLLPGLQDLCVSRTSFKWGIQVDFDEKHVVYVWLDALSNYITGIGYDADGNSSDTYKKFWPADLHLIGKDIIRFHTIYWPIFLMSLGEPLPKQIFGHPWLLQGGEKMSKSKGNVIYVDDLIDIFGLDAVRYFVLHEMPYENDGTITWELMTERVNSDLANTLGNLVNRTVAMSNKYFGGVVEDKGVADPAIDDDLKGVLTGTYAAVEKDMETLHVADALTEIFNAFKRLNKYIDETEPWKLAKEEDKQDRLATVLYNLAEGITIGASLLAPFLPDTASKIVSQLGTELRDFDSLDRFGLNGAGRVTESPEILFARLDKDEILKKAAVVVEKQRADYVEHQKKACANLLKAGRISQEEADRQLAALVGEPARDPSRPAKTLSAPDPDSGSSGVAGSDSGSRDGADQTPIHVEKKDEIEYDDFAKCQFVVGEILACEEVPKSKKLLCSQVKVGDRTVQILSGIKAYYKPEEMVGKKVMVLLNLKPVKMAGLESQGMLLCAEDENDHVVLMTPEKGLPSGSMIC
ncbi:MAG: methionine--tRNA ligase [Lachnospiraceae bacterium]|nr:methionine--tRNA ligase [Lachnospiraceae bacterium]